MPTESLPLISVPVLLEVQVREELSRVVAGERGIKIAIAQAYPRITRAAAP